MTSTGEPVIRPAAPGDEKDLARAHVLAWQTAYQEVLPADFLAGLTVQRYEAGWRRRLADPAPGTRSLAVLDGEGRAAGFATVGPLRDAQSGEDALGELWAINLRPDVWGSGLALPLLRAGESSLVELGYCHAVLWVVIGNARARRFYERAGWRTDGEERTDTRFGPALAELRYQRHLPC